MYVTSLLSHDRLCGKRWHCILYYVQDSQSHDRLCGKRWHCIRYYVQDSQSHDRLCGKTWHFIRYYVQDSQSQYHSINSNQVCCFIKHRMWRCLLQCYHLHLRFQHTWISQDVDSGWMGKDDITCKPKYIHITTDYLFFSRSKCNHFKTNVQGMKRNLKSIKQCHGL